MYTWNQIGINEITNLYLYGTTTKPTNLVDETLIRSENDITTIEMDAVSFMSSGPGRFASGTQIEIVADFMSGAISISGTGVQQTFNLAQIVAMGGGSNIYTLYASDYIDANSDHAWRTYMYQTESFKLADGAVFIIEADGTRHIDNYAILPFDDNFDFDSESSSSQFGNAWLKPRIDPFNIGRKVVIEFDPTSKNNVPRIDYTQEIYSNDLQQTTLKHNPGVGAEALLSEMPALINNLWSVGITKFTDSSDRPIYFGTLLPDILSESNLFSLNGPLSVFSNLKDLSDNGVVLIGATGGDSLVGGDSNDYLIGGDGVGNDTLVGGQGIDTYMWNEGDGIDTIIETDEDGNTSGGTLLINGHALTNIQVATHGHVGAGASPTYTGLIYKADLVGATAGEIQSVQLTYQSTQKVLTVYTGASTDGIIIKEFDPQNNNFGIVLPPVPTTPPVDIATYVGGDGTAGNDAQGWLRYVYGTEASSAFVFNKSTGNDLWMGTEFVDTYVWGLGAGVDVIQNFADLDANNTVVYTAQGDIVIFDETITPENIIVRQDSLFFDTETLQWKAAGSPGDWAFYDQGDYDYEISVKGSPDILYVARATAVSDFGSRDIAEFRFSDGSGTVWTTHDLTVRALEQAAASTEDTTSSGDDVSNTVVAGIGNNVLHMNGGDDTADGGDGNDVINGGAGDDILDGGSDNDIINGGADDDILDGGVSNDTIDGGTGNDTLIGGDGNDVYIYDPANGNGGNDVIIENDTNPNRVDKLKINTLPGSILVNQEGDDLVICMLTNLGALTGDSITIQGWFASPDNQIQQVIFSNGYTLNTEQLEAKILHPRIIEGTSLDEPLFGQNGFEETIYGYEGNDILDGGAGVDTLIGGQGNDVYVLDDQDIIIEASDAGINDAITNVNFSVDLSVGVFSNIENAYLAGDDLILIGNSANNTLSALGANNVISSDDGHDKITLVGSNGTISGGYGNDVISLSGSGTILGDDGTDNISLILKDGGNVWIDGGAEDDSINVSRQYGSTGYQVPATILGGSGTDSITVSGNGYSIDGGNDSDSISISNTSTVGPASNTITAGAGDDSVGIARNGSNNTVDGGDGNDTISFSANPSLTGSVVVDLTLGTAKRGGTTIATFSNFENISGTTSTGDTLIGNASANILYGGAGGGDNLQGGDGNDTYVVHATSDVITETGGTSGGIDLVLSSVSFTLADNNSVEKLTLTSGQTNGRVVTGNSYSNVITGWSGADTLNGGAGADTLIGGAGNDVYIVDGNSTDVMIENESGGLDTILSSINYTLIDNNFIENVTLIGSAVIATGNTDDNVITGNNNNNTLAGGLGDDTLLGGVGSDLLIGGLGDDVYFIDGFDVIDESAESGIDTVVSDVSYTLGNDVENLTLLGYAYKGRGNSLNNIIIGSDEQGNLLEAIGGSDTLYGRAGNDLLDSEGGNHTLFGESGDDWLSHYGGVGDNTMNGGSDLDTYGIYTDVAGAVVNLETGVAISELGTDILIDIENVDTTSFDDVITGNDANNIFYDEGGNDIYQGGLGSDTVNYKWSGSQGINANLMTQTVTETNVSDVLNSIENIVGSHGGDVIVGDVHDNTLNGLAGNDTLDGGWAGADLLSGGEGDDTLIVSGINSVVEGAADNDTLITHFIFNTLYGDAGNDTLTANFYSNTLFGGDDSDILISNSDLNILDGGAGNDVLTVNTGWFNTLLGGAGDDTFIGTGNNGVNFIDGGADVDTYDASGEGAGIIINVATGHVNNINGGADIILDGIENIIGTVFDDQYIWGTTDNITMQGGFGDDTYTVLSTDNVITENADEGIDTVYAGVSYTLADDVENLMLGYIQNVAGTGNALDNTMVTEGASTTLFGLDGNDSLTTNSYGVTLDGGADNDVLIANVYSTSLIGGAGNDTYVINDTYNFIVENEDEGIDTLQSSVSYALTGSAAYIENLTLTGSAVVGTGNGSSNIIIGNAQANTLDGGADNDTLTGGAGDDTYLFASGNDVIFENDSTSGNNDTLKLVGIYPTDIVDIVRIGMNIKLIIDSSNSITINNWFLSEARQVETILFEDTTSWSAATLTSMSTVAPIIGTNSGEYLEGYDYLDDVVQALGGNDEIWTQGGNDTIDAGDGNDTIWADVGDDTIDGGDDVDTYLGWWDNAQGIVVDLEAGEVTDAWGDTDQLISIEYVEATDFADTIYGSEGSDTVHGVWGDDTIYGYGGNDTLYVSRGDSTVYGGSGDDYVEWKPNPGNFVDHQTYFGEAGEDFISSARYGYSYLDGGADDDTLIARGEDIVIGGAGADVMTADELLNQTVSYETATSGVIVNLDDQGVAQEAGNDTNSDAYGDVITDIYNVTGSIYADELTAHETHAGILLGLAGDDILNGGEGDDTLNGGADDDTLLGGDGNDLFIVSSGVDTIDGGEDQDTLSFANSLTGVNYSSDNTNVINVEHIVGSDYSDELQGSIGIFDILEGGAGDDTLTADGDSDTLIGGAGADVFTTATGSTNTEINYATAGSAVVVDLTGQTTQTGDATGDVFDNLEGNILLVGSNYDDTLIGTTGVDELIGGLGADILIGGDGDDYYYVDNASDVVTELIYEGIDLVVSTANDYTLSEDIENLNLNGSAVSGTGNDLGNVITGNNNGNWLDGAAGNDTLYGGLENDNLLGGSGDDTLYGYAGDDMISSGIGHDTVYGGSDYDFYSAYHIGIERESGVVVNLSTGEVENVDGDTVELHDIEGIIGTHYDDTLIGSAADNGQLIGGLGDDILISGAGDEVLAGGAASDMYIGAGNDIYQLGRGTGQDIIVDYSQYAWNADHDVLSYVNDTSVDYDQLWFTHIEDTDDLEVSIIGTNDKVIIENWYAETELEKPIAEIQAGGKVLLDSEVEALVQAMSSLTPPAVGETQLSQQTYYNDLATVIAANWT